MFVTTPGHIKDNFYWVGSANFPMFLWDGPVPALFEGGATYAGQAYVDSIRSILGDREPELIFVTHAHWDHCGAVFYLKRAFPSLKVVASPLAGEILKKQSAINLITVLNDEIRKAMKVHPDSGVDPDQIIDEPFQAFEVDIELADGQVFDLGDGATVQVFSTPGHTRDHTSYFLPKGNILVGCETAGLLEWSGNISVEFAADYDDYIDSLRRVSSLLIDTYCQGHGLVMTDRKEVTWFLESSLQRALDHKVEIYQLLDEENGVQERVIQRMKAKHYDAIEGAKQPEITYTLNLTAQVRHLAGKKEAGL